MIRKQILILSIALSLGSVSLVCCRLQSAEKDETIPPASPTSRSQPTSTITLDATQSVPTSTQTETVVPIQDTPTDTQSPTNTPTEFLLVEATLTPLPLHDPPSGALIVNSWQDLTYLRLDTRSKQAIWEITADRHFLRNPKWSPNGQWIAYIELDANNGGERIILIHPDGTQERAIFWTNETIIRISWSPDNSSIYLTNLSKNEDVYWHNIFVVDITSFEVRQITRTITLKHNLALSPDGGILVYDEPILPYYKLFQMDLSSGEVSQIPYDSYAGSFSWSPDGTQLVVIGVSSKEGPECRDLFIIDREGEVIRQLTDLPGAEFAPVWSPDGKWIAFMKKADCERNSDNGLFIVSPDGVFVEQILPYGFNCPDGFDWYPLPLVEPGQYYAVTESGAPLNVREQPGTDGIVLEKLWEDETIYVLEGPVDVDGYRWWKVKSEGEVEGWIAEFPGWLTIP